MSKQDEFTEMLLRLSLPPKEASATTLLIGPVGYQQLMNRLKDMNAIGSIKDDVRYGNGMHSITFDLRKSKTDE